MRHHGLRIVFVLILLQAAGGPSSRAESTPGEHASQTPVPKTPWSPVAAPLPAAAPKESSSGIPPGLRERLSSLTMAEVIDIALRNNTLTRASWAEAKSAAANLGSERSRYYPEVEVEAGVTRIKQAAVGGRFSFQQTSYGPSVGINYLLLDFGGRKGEVDKARNALIAADWSHNAAIQDVVLLVQEAYFNYLNAKAQLTAAGAAVKEAEVNLDAAETRHDAGVATIAEVLQAKTAQSQAELARVETEGRIDVMLGALVTSMGLPANTKLDVGDLPIETPVERATGEVDRIIEKAVAGRPDLAAARARALEAENDIKVARSNRRPTLNLSASADRTYYSGGGNDDNWVANLSLTFPLFDGFKRKYDLRKAEEDAAAAQARVDELEQQVILDVWTSHRAVKTAAKRVLASRDLLASAEQNEEVALGRYEEGVGSIIDLLTAQSLLASARAAEIQARSDWFIAMAGLAHAAGSIGPSPGDAEGSGGGGPLETP